MAGEAPVRICGCGETLAFLVPSVSTVCNSKSREVASRLGVSHLQGHSTPFYKEQLYFSVTLGTAEKG